MTKKTGSIPSSVNTKEVSAELHNHPIDVVEDLILFNERLLFVLNLAFFLKSTEQSLLYQQCQILLCLSFIITL